VTPPAFEPFTARVPDEVLDDLRVRLAETRWPDQIPGTGWEYGTDLAYLQDLCRTWRDEFDWRAWEDRLNAWPQYTTELRGERWHVIHAPSPHPDALPLVLVHGWPGSVVEFLDVIEPLRNPEAHGGPASDAFHVVVPSIPGYGFSGPTRHAGFDVHQVAAGVAELMAALGYQRYGAQGGDWGAITVRRLGETDAGHLAGVHMNMALVGFPTDPAMHEGLTETERRALAEAAEVGATGTGYLKLQSTRPHTLGYALDDSPAGLASWIVEKFQAWTDCEGPDGVRHPERALTRDQMLANITLYWVTATATSAARLYFESRRAGSSASQPWAGRLDVPVGVAIYPRELFRPPRRWVEAAANVVHWSEQPRGGHFAAFEQPELFVDDVRAFFRLVR
jgi:pimeloyl-ACP methyl ester carboxylesterase